MEIALLDNKKSIANLVEVDTNKSILEFIENQLESDEYNFIVTAENIPFAKKQMAELNKSKKYIDTFRKDKVNIESVSIDLFKKNVKGYITPIELKYEELKKKVEVFEKETKDNILKELSLYCEEFVKIQGIRDNFLDVDIVDLIVLGSVTAKGSLTKKSKETVEARVNVCKSKQDKYDMRLMQLENKSYEAKLESPLTITHVQGIISLDSDAEYETQLNELISAEIKRQNITKANLQREADEKAEREAQQKVLDEQNRINGIFLYIASNPDLDIDTKINNISDYNFIQFGDFESYARGEAQKAISSLNLLKDEIANLDKSLDNGVISVEDAQKQNDIPTTHETIAFTPKEKAQMTNDDKNVENDKKVVYIDVKLQFKVKKTVASDRILDKVNQMLADAGFSESILSVEVV